MFRSVVVVFLSPLQFWIAFELVRNFTVFPFRCVFLHEGCVVYCHGHYAFGYFFASEMARKKLAVYVIQMQRLSSLKMSVNMLPDLKNYTLHYAVCHILTPLHPISNYKEQTIQPSAVTFRFKFIETKGFFGFALNPHSATRRTPFDTK